MTDGIQREVLPIPDRGYAGLITYDAKDPDTAGDADRARPPRVQATVPMLFSADETCDVGADSATPVSDDYGPRDSEFTGRIQWVQIDIDEAAEDVDHLITPEERLRIAMARQ